MVQTLSSFTFKGSITEAIIEAKQQKKLFVVYVSGTFGIVFLFHGNCTELSI